MVEIERALELTSEILAEAERYPWKTAAYLAKKIRERGCSVDAGELEEALIARTRLPDRQVRYSFFPARKTLDLLWGHVRNVNDFERLPDPALEANAGEFTSCDVPDHATWCFLSHNFLDVGAVMAIRDDLLRRGHGVWIAEAEVLAGEMITHKVQEGLERSDQFVLYATRNSLASRWVLKEAGVAVARWRLPPIVLVDGADAELVELFQAWIEPGWDDGLPASLDRLLTDSGRDPAATELPVLLVGALGSVAAERRIVASYPPTEARLRPDMKTFDQAFGEAGSD